MALTAKKIATDTVNFANDKKQRAMVCPAEFGLSLYTLRQELYRALGDLGSVKTTVDSLTVIPVNEKENVPVVHMTKEFFLKKTQVDLQVATLSRAAPSQLVVFNTDKLTENSVLALRVLLKDGVYETIELVGLTLDDFNGRFPVNAPQVVSATTKRGIVIT